MDKLKAERNSLISLPLVSKELEIKANQVFKICSGNTRGRTSHKYVGRESLLEISAINYLK